MKNIFFVLILLTAFKAQAQIDTTSLVVGQKFYVDSKILNEKVEVWLRLPSDFDKAKDSCSLLVLLDGDEYFKAASDIAELYEWAKVMPPTVIIGLPSTGASRWAYYTPTNVKYSKQSEKSNYEDSLRWSTTGQFSQYAGFMQKELIPSLSKFLDANFISKTIFGHSNGGLGAMSFYTLAPTIFDKYIVASPAILWDNYFIQKNISGKIRNDALFMTLGVGGWDYKIDSFSFLKVRLQQTNNFFKFVVYDQDGHPTTGLRTLMDGLRYVYKNEK